MDEEAIDRLSRRYIRFAESEARGRSPSYADLGIRISGDREILGFLLTLPLAKRQPNLLLAAMRRRFELMTESGRFWETLLANRGTVRELMLARSTQTNEPARCATLLPVLSLFPPPLALIEVGASAGLCLLPDHYGYHYGTTYIQPAKEETEAPIFECITSVKVVEIGVALRWLRIKRLRWKSGWVGCRSTAV